MGPDQVDEWSRPPEWNIHSRPVRRLDSCHEVLIAPADTDLLQRERTIFAHDGDARAPGFGCEVDTDKEHHGSLPRERGAHCCQHAQTAASPGSDRGVPIPERGLVQRQRTPPL